MIARVCSARNALVMGLALLSCCAFATPAKAQVPAAVPGDRIRVSVLKPRPRRVTGNLLSLTPDSLHFRRGKKHHAFTLQVVKKLEVSTGKKERVTGTLVGIVAGGLFGGFIGSAIERGTSDACFDSCGLGGFIVGALVGSIGGGIAGYALLAGDRWERVPLPESQHRLSSAAIQFRIAL